MCLIKPYSLYIKFFIINILYTSVQEPKTKYFSKQLLKKTFKHNSLVRPLFSFIYKNYKYFMLEINIYK